MIRVLLKCSVEMKVVPVDFEFEASSVLMLP